jgi:hypothetical protein
VQAAPSSQGEPSETAAFTHPTAESQLSSVHWFESSQTTGGPLRQLPSEQVSPAVQREPSSHAAVLFDPVHPSAGSQKSSVHGFESSHVMAVPD